MFAEVAMYTDVAMSSTPALARAWLKDKPAWFWELRQDNGGLYRWYLTDEVPTRLCGVTLTDAETALKVFSAYYFEERVVITTDQAIPDDLVLPGRAHLLEVAD